jgi:hypothetical protein
VPIDLALRILREYREVDPDGRVAVREIAIILLAGALLATACASGGGAASESPQSRSAEVIEVSATEYAFSVPPEVRGGVVAMRFTNTGSLPHEFAFGRIDPGRGLEDLRAFVESGEEPPDWMHDVAGVPALSPGRSVTVTRTLAPGTYTFLCYLPLAGWHSPRETRDVRDLRDRGRDRRRTFTRRPGHLRGRRRAERAGDPPGVQTVELRNEGPGKHGFLIVRPEDPDATFEQVFASVEEWFKGASRGRLRSPS